MAAWAIGEKMLRPWWGPVNASDRWVVVQSDARAFACVFRASGVQFSAHDLRHVWATWHVMAGTPITELQELGAWKSELMVKRYAHFAPEQLRTAANRLGTFLGAPGSATNAEVRTTSRLIWLPDQGSNLGPAD
jgi:hypothetical protein